jgi:hypothetical protein
LARLNIDDKFFGDIRIERLALLSGEPRVTTTGRIIRLWWDSIDRLESERSAEDIDLHAEWFNPGKGCFADLMVAAKLATKMDDGNYRLAGVEERMQWLVEKREESSLGGKISSANRPRDAKGRLMPKPREISTKVDGCKKNSSINPRKSSTKVKNDSDSTQVTTKQHLDDTQVQTQVDLGSDPTPSSPLALALVLNTEECAFSEKDAYDFELIYSHYPKRKGHQEKKRAFAKLNRDFSTPEKYDDLFLAVQNYKTHCVREKIEGTPYVMQFATFVNGPWDEYLNQQIPINTWGSS